MADPPIQGLAKLQLDEETGEMVSKSELKKRMQKRAKKAAKAAAPPKPPKEKSENQKKAVGGQEEPTHLDRDAVFKQGFLSEVFKERPSEHVITRFPPEPSGHLHIGHAKAIAVNFGFARFHGGECILRFDDTNPAAEEGEYFDAIEDIVRWLGFKPSRITYASDNFQRLYDCAEQLIQMDKAYVCHCNEAEIKKQRGGEDGASPRYRCEHASQDVETNLDKFRDMRDGKYEPQTAFLRLKQDMLGSGNPQMWDVAAYRIPKEQHHHRTLDRWKVYATYDGSHCLCDSFEGVTHSLCTTEFITARESYDWLNRTLGVYEPMQREYGRLNVSGTITSKRRLKQLIAAGAVRGWDDPRLYTLIAIRRRGVPPGAILAFINELGVTTAQTLIDIKRFEQTIRRFLETTVPRLSLVLEPLAVTLDNIADLEGSELEVPFSPKNPSLGSYKVRLTSTVYIDRADFREEASDNFFRLAPGKTVGLLQVPLPITATSFSKDEATGLITKVHARFERAAATDDKPIKPKTWIHWVPSPSSPPASSATETATTAPGSRKVQVRLFNPLFRSANPTAAPGGFLNDINPASEQVFPDALIVSAGLDAVRARAPWPAEEGEKDTANTADDGDADKKNERRKAGPESVRFQGMRVGYFAMDSDSTDEKTVLNRIVSLKEDAGKA